MKRHIKLFEDFSQEATPMHQAKGHALWALMFHPDGVMYGVYPGPAEAKAAKKMISGYVDDSYWDEIYADIKKKPLGTFSEEDFETEDEDMIDIQRITVGKNSKTDGMLFSYAMNAASAAADWPGQKPQEMVKTLIMAGGNPFAKAEYHQGFESIQSLVDFFGGDIGWYPGGRAKMEQDLRRAGGF